MACIHPAVTDLWLWWWWCLSSLPHSGENLNLSFSRTLKHNHSWIAWWAKTHHTGLSILNSPTDTDWFTQQFADWFNCLRGKTNLQHLQPLWLFNGVNPPKSSTGHIKGAAATSSWFIRVGGGGGSSPLGLIKAICVAVSCRHTNLKALFMADLVRGEEKAQDAPISTCPASLGFLGFFLFVWLCERENARLWKTVAYPLQELLYIKPRSRTEGERLKNELAFFPSVP